MTEVIVRTWYSQYNITGPSAVWVSLAFGNAPPAGPTVTKLLKVDAVEAEVRFDLERHLQEISAGVARANTEYCGALEVEAVQIVPNDYPSPGQAQHVAFQIAKHVLSKV